MKRWFYLFLFSALLVACKDDENGADITVWMDMAAKSQTEESGVF